MVRLATVFSGIGAIEHALKRMKIDYSIEFACDNGERYLKESFEEIREEVKDLPYIKQQKEIKKLYASTKKTNYSKKVYFDNYEINENQWYEDVRFIDGSKHKGKVDLFVGGSPCQSFSIIGKRAGLDDARGTLFYDFARLVDEIQPKVFIYENVYGLKSHDSGNTWKVVNDVFDSLNYNHKTFTLNSRNYGIPQDRRRIFVVGFKDDLMISKPEEQELITTASDYLEKDPVLTRHYLGKKGFEFVTSIKYKNRARVNHDVIQTQKANQQYNWNGDFVFVPFDSIKNEEDILQRAYVGDWNGKRGAIRQMTYRECLRLMGFDDDFIYDLPNIKAYRHVGNSIVVNVLEALMREIEKVVDFNEKETKSSNSI